MDYRDLFKPSLLSTKFAFELSSEGRTLTRENLRHDKSPQRVTECALQGERGDKNDVFWRYANK